MKRQVFRVTYDRQTPTWIVGLEGRSRPLIRAISKAEAVELALKLGRSAESGSVVVHRADGSIEREYTFGEHGGPNAN